MRKYKIVLEDEYYLIYRRNWFIWDYETLRSTLYDAELYLLRKKVKPLTRYYDKDGDYIVPDLS